MYPSGKIEKETSKGITRQLYIIQATSRIGTI